MTSPQVTVSPAHRWGQPAIGGITTEALSDLYWGVETADTIGNEYDLTRHQLLVAWWYEGTHGQPRYRRRWKTWAVEVGPQLWNVSTLDPDRVPLPPTADDATGCRVDQDQPGTEHEWE